MDLCDADLSARNGHWEELAALEKEDCDRPVFPSLLTEFESLKVDVEDCFCLCVEDGDEKAADEWRDEVFLLEADFLLLLGSIISVWADRAQKQ